MPTLAPLDPARVAAALRAGTALDVAFLLDGDRVVFARAPKTAWGTAVSALIAGIWQAAPRQALRLLRRPIYLLREPTEAEREMIRVAAKRWRQIEPAQDAVTGWLSIDVSAAAAISRRLAAIWLVATPTATPMEMARVIAGGGRREGHRARQDRPVGAVLVGASGRVIAAARNRNGRCRVRHAELSLLQAWGEANGPIPAGSTLWVTLQPCRMCAAWWVAASGGAARVVFAERDPGPMAQGTALERLGIQRFLDEFSSC